MKYKIVVYCPKCNGENMHQHGPEKPLLWYCSDCGNVESYKSLEDCFKEDDTKDEDAV